MDDLFALVVEYRHLLSRRQTAGALLTLPERHRLDALDRLLGREPTDDEGTAPGALGRRRHARCDVRLKAALRVAGRVIPLEVVNLGAGGVGVLAAEPVPSGARGVLRVLTGEAARVHECAALVSWECEADEGGWLAGLRFEGAPVELPLAC